MKKQPKTERNPKGAGLPPPPENSKTFQMRSVPVCLHSVVREYIIKLIKNYENSSKNIH